MDIECGMVVDTRRAGLNISETADLQRFSHTVVCSLNREWSKKKENIPQATPVWMKIPW